MSEKLLKSLTASHLNSLNQTVGSLETQIAALKTVLKELGGKPGKASEETEDDEADEELDDEEDEKPAKSKKTSKKKPAKVEEDEDESDDESEDESDEDESDNEDESDDEESEDDDDEGGKKATKKDVVKALQAYAAENNRAASIKMLKKFGVKSVHDLPASKYQKLIDALEA